MKTIFLSFFVVEHFNNILQYFKWLKWLIIGTETLLFCNFCSWETLRILVLFVVLELEELEECWD